MRKGKEEDFENVGILQEHLFICVYLQTIYKVCVLSPLKAWVTRGCSLIVKICVWLFEKQDKISANKDVEVNAD